MRSGRRARRKTGTRVRRTAIGAALAGVTVLAFQAAANGAVFGTEDDKGQGEKPSPYSAEAGHVGSVKDQLHKVALTDKGKGEAVLSQRDTAPFGLLGVTWSGTDTKIKGTIEVRTRSMQSGEWSDWIELEPTPTGMDGTRKATGGSTAPVWVGASDGAEVRVSDGAAAGELPDGLKLVMVDPRGAGADAERDGDFDAEPAAFVTGTTPPSVPGPPSKAPQPRVVTREEWKADSVVATPEPSDYLAGGIKAAFVHHTDTAAEYDCSESVSIVQGILLYHVTNPDDPWRDIGYNFLVDKCGTIFEGREGGIDQPVQGAHTYGWNSQSTGIAVIGNYMEQSASNAALASVSKIAAYKLGQYGVDPAGKSMLTAGATQTVGGKQFVKDQTYSFNTISGHRDGFATACPGTMLYPQLPTIRSYATGSVANLAISSLSGGATQAGTGYETTGPVTVNWGTTTPNTFIHKFEVLVDDQVATWSWGHMRSASVNVGGYGDHTVKVRATHTSGKVTTSPAVTVTVPGPKTFKPVAPARLMDTRTGLGVAKAKVGPAGEVVLTVAGKAGIPTTGVGAVVLNVTATGPTATGYVSVYPNGTVRTSASNLNFTAGKTIANLVTVPVIDGKVRFYNHSGSVDLLADVTGYYAKDTSGSTFTHLEPKRLMDTRNGTGVAQAKVGAAGTVDLQVAGANGIPADATAVVLNVTATGPTSGGYVSVFPSGGTRPGVSNLNFTAGQTIPNLAIVPIGEAGKVSFYNHAGTVDLLADVTGYFSADATGASHINIGPKRLMDTRSGLGVAKGPVAANSSVTLNVAGVQGVPATGVTAVVLNVTATNPTSGGFVTVYPAGPTVPTVSNLNFTAGLTIPNLVVVPVSADGKVNFYNRAGNVDLLADITGYFTK